MFKIYELIEYLKKRPQLLLLPLAYFFPEYASFLFVGAIAFDAASGNFTTGATSLTITHTCAGSNRLVLVGFLTNTTTASPTSVEYDGVAMTQLKVQTSTTNGFRSFVYGLLNPNTTANASLVISFAASQLIYAGCSSYTGVLQSGLPDASVSEGQDEGTTWSIAITTVANNCWVFAHGRIVSPLATAPDVIRNTQEGLNFIADSNAAVSPAGSYTINGTNTDGGDETLIAISFAPAAVVAVDGNPNLLMMGIQ